MILRVYEGWEESIGGNLGPEAVPKQPVSEIQKYTVDGIGTVASDTGKWVRYGDHLAVVAALMRNGISAALTSIVIGNLAYLAKEESNG